MIVTKWRERRSEAASNVNKHPAILLDLSETGLGVGRSLGRQGIKVIGLDHYKNIGFSSRYIKAQICPHPINDEANFLDFLIDIGRQSAIKPVLFVASDSFLKAISNNRDRLSEYFLFNLPSKHILDQIIDKRRQHQLVLKAGIEVPISHPVKTKDDVRKIRATLRYPVFVKGIDVNTWRKSSFGKQKGYYIKSQEEFEKLGARLLDEKIEFLVQEIIEGPDTNHYKVCSYISKNGENLMNFTLQKIRQCPIRFGVGSTIESLDYPELAKLGEKLALAINYRGVMSTEFKIDARDNKLKLIEINPRFWQQNALAESCGMNFPLMQYLDLTNQNPKRIIAFEKGTKWVNIYMDTYAFLSYHRLKKLTFFSWIKSLKGKRVYSGFAWDDILPGIHEIWSEDKLRKFPKTLSNIRGSGVFK